MKLPLRPARSRAWTLLICVAALAAPTAVSASGAARTNAGPTVLARGPLIDLDGQEVGQVSLEQQDSALFLHVKNAAGAAGTTLELLLSPSRRSLQAGDHSGPGPQAVRVGTLDRPDVRLPLPKALRPGTVRSVWVWCASVRLPSARALLKVR